MRYTIHLPHKIYSGLRPAEWAQANCPSYLSATLNLMEDPETSTAEYHFADEKDAMAFSLKWL
jgi:hypothetical protein